MASKRGGGRCFTGASGFLERKIKELPNAPKEGVSGWSMLLKEQLGPRYAAETPAQAAALLKDCREALDVEDLGNEVTKQDHYCVHVMMHIEAPRCIPTHAHNPKP
jgi:hypothetical protein